MQLHIRSPPHHNWGSRRHCPTDPDTPGSTYTLEYPLRDPLALGTAAVGRRRDLAAATWTGRIIDPASRWVHVNAFFWERARASTQSCLSQHARQHATHQHAMRGRPQGHFLMDSFVMIPPASTWDLRFPFSKEFSTAYCDARMITGQQHIAQQDRWTVNVTTGARVKRHSAGCRCSVGPWTPSLPG